MHNDIENDDNETDIDNEKKGNTTAKTNYENVTKVPERPLQQQLQHWHGQL